MDLADLRAVVRADLAAKGHASDRLTVLVLRLGQYSSSRRTRLPLHLVYRLVDLVWTRMIVGAELPPTAQVGPGLRLPHWGRGVILHPRTVIGSNAFIYHGVTIGESKGRTPVIGDDVYIGARATIVGDVTVGDRVRIGAGAVVVRDVASDSSAVGVPARTASAPS
ncbi:serine acetyltransferase [Rathayibacter sp. AY1B7]|uniref:serine acetyltransferase n=1 Tax=Rathayibacter sp. AY1B7 TaxID=2080532 RepID=UPI000CE8E3A2|nr:serine acetyltransferase [Rathayibacter sp. AY1B7]PPH97923.1 serine acetyltransferase [Rathayibacter sp. AY1B7]